MNINISSLAKPAVNMQEEYTVKRIPILLITCFLSSLFISVVFAVTAPGVHATSTGFRSVPNGYGYADYAVIPSISGNTTYGPNVPVALDCTAISGTNPLTNSANNTSLGLAGSSGTAQSTITVSTPGTSETVQTSADVQNLNLLGGLITAGEIHALVASTATPTGATSTNSSSLSGMLIAGVPVVSNPAPNTTITLPGFGYVVLNEQMGPVNGPTSTSIGVNMVDVYITNTNILSLPVNTRIVIAHADSASQPSAITATGYGFYASGLGGSPSTIGPAASTGISCEGGSTSVTSAGFTDPTIGGVGSEISSASGRISSSLVTGTAQNSVSSSSLLNGLLSIGKVTTTATANYQGTGATSISGSASFENTNIAGTALPTNPAPNTRQNLPGLGYVVINEEFGSTTASGASETTIGLDIYVTVTNSFGLPIGANIVVSRAYVSVSGFSNNPVRHPAPIRH